MDDQASIGASREGLGDHGPRFAACAGDAGRPESPKSEVYPPPRVWVARARRVVASVTLGSLLLALPAYASDGGVWDQPLYDQCPDAPLPEAVEVRGSFFEPVDHPDGGTSWLLPPARAARVACLMATCEEHRSRLEQGDVAPMELVLALAIGMGVGLATGAVLVWQVKH